MALIRVYDESSNVIETHEHKGEFGRQPYRKGDGLVTFHLFRRRSLRVMYQSNVQKGTLARIVGNGGPIAKCQCSPLGLAPS